MVIEQKGDAEKAGAPKATVQAVMDPDREIPNRLLLPPPATNDVPQLYTVGVPELPR